MLSLAERHDGITFHWAVFTATGERLKEACQAATRFTSGGTLVKPWFPEFKDGFLPYSAGEVKTLFEQIKGEIQPDIIFTHNQHDAHQDHRLISEMTWSTFRDHFILEYEIPKYDGDMGRPSLFFPLSRVVSQQKIDYLLRSFGSQKHRQWFEGETFSSLMRLRGMECNAASGYAEAFYCRKLAIR